VAISVNVVPKSLILDDVLVIKDASVFRGRIHCTGRMLRLARNKQTHGHLLGCSNSCPPPAHFRNTEGVLWKSNTHYFITVLKPPQKESASSDFSMLR
jgi:hypothetical protein